MTSVRKKFQLFRIKVTPRVGNGQKKFLSMLKYVAGRPLASGEVTATRGTGNWQ